MAEGNFGHINEFAPALWPEHKGGLIPGVKCYITYGISYIIPTCGGSK